MSGRVSAPAVEEGDRIGRFVVFRDQDGRVLAIAAGAVSAICETDDGGVLVQFSGKLSYLDQPIATVLTWLDGGPSRPRTAAERPLKSVRGPFKHDEGQA